MLKKLPVLGKDSEEVARGQLHCVVHFVEMFGSDLNALQFQVV